MDLFEHRHDIMAAHKGGESCNSIAKRYGVKRDTVSKWVGRWAENINATSQKDPDRTDDVLEMYAKVGTQEGTALALGVNRSTVKKALAKDKQASKVIADPSPGVIPAEAAKLKRFVVTCALNNCDVNLSFLKSLQTFCEVENAQLLVIPVAYKNVSLFSGAYNPEWPKVLEKYYITGDLELSSNLVIMGSMRIQATAARPLQGTIGVSKGKSAIFGHPRLALETVPTPMSKMPLVYMTSCTVSKPEYSNTKAGRLGEFHHNPGATIIETDGNKFWWRHVHPDKFGSFIDIKDQYGPDGSVFPALPAEAVIVGDVHVGFDDPSVVDAVVGDLVMSTRAKNVILHDLLDFFSASHHHINSNVLRVLKAARGKSSVYGELQSVASWLDKYCKSGTRYHIIRSNHHDHLDRWLNNNSALIDAENLWLWHHLNAVQMKIALDMVKSAKHAEKWGVTSAFELAMQALCKKNTLDLFSFADDKTPLEFCGIDCSNHGDKGPNGARGSRAGFARVQRKTFIGHSHSPGIHDGCYQVGKSAKGEAYLSGYSSHLHCSGMIYSDGNRTLFPIIDGLVHLKGVV